MLQVMLKVSLYKDKHHHLEVLIYAQTRTYIVYRNLYLLRVLVYQVLSITRFSFTYTPAVYTYMCQLWQTHEQNKQYHHVISYLKYNIKHF